MPVTDAQSRDNWTTSAKNEVNVVAVVLFCGSWRISWCCCWFQAWARFFASRARVLCSANFFPAATWPGSFAGFASFTSVVTAGWAGACFSSVVVFASMLIWKIKDLGEVVRFLFVFFNRFLVRVFMKINVLCCNKSGIGNCMQVAAVQCSAIFPATDDNFELIAKSCYFCGARSKAFVMLRNVPKMLFLGQDWARKICRFSVLFGSLTKWEPNLFEISRDHFDFFGCQRGNRARKRGASAADS